MLAACRWSFLDQISTMNLLIVLFVLIDSEWIAGDNYLNYNYRRIHVRPGRHVCLSETVHSRPVPVRQKFQKAVYIPRQRNCNGHTSCPQYDITYKTATKTVYQQHRSGSFTHDCCEGWTTRHNWEKGCMQPVCISGCGDLGRCVLPGVCECPRGFQGENCDTDIDECSSDDHDCHQFCINTAGSYLCACQDGFSLAEDGKTCIYCYTCSKEYVDMQQELKKLREDLKESQAVCQVLQHKLDTLEENFEKVNAYNLQRNLTEVENKVYEILASVEVLREAQLSVSTVTPLTSEATQTTEPLSSAPDAQEPVRESMSTGSASQKATEVQSPTSHRTALTGTRTTAPYTSKPVPDKSTTTLPKATTSASTYGQQHLPYFMYEWFESLNQQIGILEERIGWCACREPP